MTRVARIAASVVVSFQVIAQSSNAQEVVPDSYIVTYRQDAARSLFSSNHISAAGITEKSLGTTAGEIRKISSVGMLTALNESQSDAVEMYGRKQQDFCNELVANRSDVETCSPNWVLKASTVPSDPQLSSLWGLTGSNGIRADQAWNTTSGSSDVVVAIIDTGIDYTHSDLSANIWVNPFEIPGNGIDDDGNGVIDDVYGVNFSGNSRAVGDPYDDNGHGTHVAGTIGAVGNNSLGVAGVNWHVKLMGLKFLGSTGSGSTSGAILALNYLVDLKNRGINVRVVNNSWGGGGGSPALREAIERANQAGILFTVAAGNSGVNIEETPQYPAAYTLPNMLKVAAIDRDGNLAYFSNYSSRLVDIAAPGVDILSTVPGNQYAIYSGTSMATPHVTGAAALYLSNHPDASVEQIKAALLGSGRELPSISGLVATGRTLDVERAVTDQTAPIVTPAPECPYQISEVGGDVDRSADAKRAVITSDEDGFYKVSLPFSFPFEGQYRDSMVISPNGVVYFNGAPKVWDNNNQASAPVNSIAALHTDLYPDPSVARGLGVRIASSSSKVTVAWKARVYNRQTENEQLIVRMTLYPSGTIQTSYSISSAGLLGAISGAVIGLKGATTASGSTYAGTITNGLKLKMIPGCQPQQSGATHVRSLSAASAKRAAVRAGSKIVLRSTVLGQGNVQLVGRIDGRRCESIAVLGVTQRQVRRVGQVPSGLKAKRITFALIGNDGKSRSATLKLQTLKSKVSGRRPKSVTSACTELMRSFE